MNLYESLKKLSSKNFANNHEGAQFAANYIEKLEKRIIELEVQLSDYQERIKKSRRFEIK